MNSDTVSGCQDAIGRLLEKRDTRGGGVVRPRVWKKASREYFQRCNMSCSASALHPALGEHLLVGRNPQF
jgi:hypothetical protein